MGSAGRLRLVRGAVIFKFRVGVEATTTANLGDRRLPPRHFRMIHLEDVSWVGDLVRGHPRNFSVGTVAAAVE